MEKHLSKAGKFFILLTAASYLTSFDYATASSEHSPIVDAAQLLQPSLTDEDADRLALALENVTADTSCEIPWQVLLAVAFKESSLNRHAVGKSKNHRHKIDFGLMQINHKNILRMGLDKDKLLKNEEYSLTVACSLLTDAKHRYSKHFRFWLGIYHSGTALWQADTKVDAEQYSMQISNIADRIGYRVYKKVARK